MPIHHLHSLGCALICNYVSTLYYRNGLHRIPKVNINNHLRTIEEINKKIRWNSRLFFFWTQRYTETVLPCTAFRNFYIFIQASHIYCHTSAHQSEELIPKLRCGAFSNPTPISRKTRNLFCWWEQDGFSVSFWRSCDTDDTNWCLRENFSEFICLAVLFKCFCGAFFVLFIPFSNN